MVTYALKIVPWNERVNESNFENHLMVGFKSKLELQEFLGKMIYHWKACIKSVIAEAKIQLEI